MRKTVVRLTLIGELVSIVFLGGIAKAATHPATTYLLFPELAALAYDIFARPAGIWAKSPFMVAATPVCTALAGLLISRTMQYHLWSIGLCIATAMLIIRSLRSPVAPAISASLLPLTLGVTSWLYPALIAVGTGLLAVLSIGYNRRFPDQVRGKPRVITDDEDDEMERSPQRFGWALPFLAFLLLCYGMGALTGLRLILFPPLVVIAFEMFAHADVCPWAARPVALPAACTVKAAAGLCAHAAFGPGPASVVAAILIGIVALRVLRLHVPPALAIGLLPQIMERPGWSFVLSVATGTLTLTATFLFAQAVSRRTRSAVSSR